LVSGTSLPKAVVQSSGYVETAHWNGNKPKPFCKMFHTVIDIFIILTDFVTLNKFCVSNRSEYFASLSRGNTRLRFHVPFWLSCIHVYLFYFCPRRHGNGIIVLNSKLGITLRVTSATILTAKRTIHKNT